MTHIEILESNILKDYHKNSDRLLRMEKSLVEHHYDWINIFHTPTEIFGKGTLNVNGESYEIVLRYSPFFSTRFDRIYITNKNIQYNRSIHLYDDMSLCLYHPIFDKPLFKFIPLYKMIPWITEWCIHYQEWKKYGVWLGKEIVH
ncbi:MAG: hypothetical protein QM687_03935 [Ferruginibacter sp.]